MKRKYDKIQEMATASKKRSSSAGMFSMFEELFKGLWMRLVPVVGVTTVSALLREAFASAKTQYRLLQHVRIKEDGIALKDLKRVMEESGDSRGEAEEALSGYLEIFVQLVRKNLGESVTQKLIDYIESSKRGKLIGDVFHRTGLNF